MPEQRVLYLKRAYWDLQDHSYSDTDIGFVVAEAWERKKTLVEGQHRIPHKRFYDHCDLYADLTVTEHVKEDGSPTQYMAFVFSWEDTDE